MTAIPMKNPTAETSASARVWRCTLCDCVHLYVGEVLLTFTQPEFADFAQEVVECYCVQTRPCDLSVENPHELVLLRILENPATSGQCATFGS